MIHPPLAHSAAAERNQAPILAVLQALLPLQGAALEIASGTGQHAAHFAAALPGWTWQPTDLDDHHFGAIAGWAAQAGARNVLPPRRLDVRAADWPADGPDFAAPFDLVYCANMLHIAPWACCAGLMQGAARHLVPGGVLVTYGPYLEDGVPTAPGNLAFDASLRAQDADWGIRRLADVAQAAADAGLRLAARHALPANNLLLVWTRATPAAPSLLSNP
jgi:SAM-dependent methyltransferase